MQRAECNITKTGPCRVFRYQSEDQCVSISKRRLWELSANEEAAFRSATISKTSFGYIENSNKVLEM